MECSFERDLMIFLVKIAEFINNIAVFYYNFRGIMYSLNSPYSSCADAQYLALLTGRVDWQESKDVLSTGAVKDSEIKELGDFINTSLNISAAVVGNCIKIKKSDLPDLFPSNGQEIDFDGIVSKVRQLLQQRSAEEPAVNVWEFLSPEDLKIVKNGPSITGYQFQYYEKGKKVEKAVTQFVLWRLSQMKLDT